MAQTTGPVLAIGAITVANATVIHDRPMDWRIPAATGIAALMFRLAEAAWPEGARLLAYTALISVLFVRLDPATPSPVESLWNWWNTGPTNALGEAARRAN